MADWGDMAIGGLLGGVTAYAGAKVMSLEQEEENARLEGMARLKEEFRIEDRDWQERMSSEKTASNRKFLLDQDEANYKRSRQDVMDDRKYNENQPSEAEKKYKFLEEKLGPEAAKQSLLETGKGGKLTKEQQFEVVSKGREAYKTYIETFDDKSDPGGFLGIGSKDASAAPMTEKEYIKDYVALTMEAFGGETRGADKGGGNVLDDIMNGDNPLENLSSFVKELSGEDKVAARAYVEENYKDMFNSSQPQKSPDLNISGIKRGYRTPAGRKRQKNLIGLLESRRANGSNNVASK